MKNNIIPFLFKKSYSIVNYVFWLYFLFIIGYYILYCEVVPDSLGYFFWLLLGIRLGYLIAMKTIDYNNKRS